MDGNSGVKEEGRKRSKKMEMTVLEWEDSFECSEDIVQGRGGRVYTGVCGIRDYG